MRDHRARSARSGQAGDCELALPAGGCASGCVHEPASGGHFESQVLLTTGGSEVDNMCFGLIEGDGCDNYKKTGVCRRRRRKGFYSGDRRSTVGGKPKIKSKSQEEAKETDRRRRAGLSRGASLSTVAGGEFQHERPDKEDRDGGNPLCQTISFGPGPFHFRDGF